MLRPGAFQPGRRTSTHPPGARARLPPVPPYRVPTRPCILGTAPWISCLPPSSPGSSIPSMVRSTRSEEHTSQLQSHLNLLCPLLLEKKKSPTRSCSSASFLLDLYT